MKKKKITEKQEEKFLWEYDQQSEERPKIREVTHMVEEKEERERECIQKLHGEKQQRENELGKKINGVINLSFRDVNNYGSKSIYKKRKGDA